MASRRPNPSSLRHMERLLSGLPSTKAKVSRTSRRVDISHRMISRWRLSNHASVRVHKILPVEDHLHLWGLRLSQETQAWLLRPCQHPRDRLLLPKVHLNYRALGLLPLRRPLITLGSPLPWLRHLSSPAPRQASLKSYPCLTSQDQALEQATKVKSLHPKPTSTARLNQCNPHHFLHPLHLRRHRSTVPPLQQTFLDWYHLHQGTHMPPYLLLPTQHLLYCHHLRQDTRQHHPKSPLPVLACLLQVVTLLHLLHNALRAMVPTLQRNPSLCLTYPERPVHWPTSRQGLLVVIANHPLS